MTHDCRLGWHHAAQLIADRMPASFNPNAPRLVRVPLPENARALDVDPAKASKPAAAPAAALGEWVEWRGDGDCPIPCALAGEWEYKTRDGERHEGSMDARGDVWRQYSGCKEFDIVAYRLLPKEPA